MGAAFVYLSTNVEGVWVVVQHYSLFFEEANTTYPVWGDVLSLAHDSPGDVGWRLAFAFLELVSPNIGCQGGVIGLAAVVGSERGAVVSPASFEGIRSATVVFECLVAMVQTCLVDKVFRQAVSLQGAGFFSTVAA